MTSFGPGERSLFESEATAPLRGDRHPGRHPQVGPPRRRGRPGPRGLRPPPGARTGHRRRARHHVGRRRPRDRAVARGRPAGRAGRPAHLRVGAVGAGVQQPLADLAAVTRVGEGPLHRAARRGHRAAGDPEIPAGASWGR